jgi:catechol 2,3-dioxygenase-like lactoylglutathione lyase family enzyme
MIDHLSIGVRSFAKAKAFYDRRADTDRLCLPPFVGRLARLRKGPSSIVDQCYPKSRRT